MRCPCAHGPLPTGSSQWPAGSHGHAPHTAGPYLQFPVNPLPYAYDALEPVIDSETLRLHHDKHYSGYVRCGG
jgi:hypothetical protein